MDDTTAASVGFALAGVALAASLAGWSAVGGTPALAGASLIAVALVAFGLRRYGVLGRRPGAVLAGGSAIGAVAAIIYAVFSGGYPPSTLLAAVVAGGATVFAYADWLGLDREGLSEKARATAFGAAVGVLGIVAIVVWYVAVREVVLLVAPRALGNLTTRNVLQTLASGVGTVSVVALYLRWSDRELSFLDAEVPDLRGMVYAIAGTFVIFGGNVVIASAFQRVGAETAQHTVVQMARTEPAVLLALIPLSYLVIAPGEELLYRNVVQKSLRESFSPVAGVVVASAIFAAVHLPAYSSPDQSLLATVNTLAIIFVLALVLGALYERTRNVVVSILAHGSFNAIAFALTYAQLTGAFGG